jgi:hypothetical protein
LKVYYCVNDKEPFFSSKDFHFKGEHMTRENFNHQRRNGLFPYSEKTRDHENFNHQRRNGLFPYSEKTRDRERGNFNHQRRKLFPYACFFFSNLPQVWNKNDFLKELVISNSHSNIREQNCKRNSHCRRFVLIFPISPFIRSPGNSLNSDRGPQNLSRSPLCIA